MELDKPRVPGDDDGQLDRPHDPLDGGPSAGLKAGLANQIERLHSQLVLESVSLRSEVAKLKKKRWVLQAVLASGGESEQRAIDDEAAQLHAANLERDRQTAATVGPDA
uniref:Uncharacterized protein n=1 Tax=Pyrodinium bahamense TaxID=73915 RepID=A0A7S0AK94_9DINO|mmetsp:Transcript_36232/g.100598  ORF Transcript_36232/g.100598 Transcript_36232/m.100598 type:complete len:109 (+) Transcript_36232:192-518(+)